MVEFKNVSKSFGSIQALSDISFSIDEGEFVFISGPSGAGKTTILRLLIGQFKPTSGEIIFDDIKVHKMKKSEVPKLRQSIGTVYQDYRLLPERTIRENIEVALAVKGVPDKQWRERVDQVLNVVGLADRAKLFPAQISGGELQRASLARALVINPKVILADEPTGNLDWKNAEGMIELFEKINKEGKTLIVTTHNQAILDKSKKRIIKLENGEVTHDGGHMNDKKSP